MRRTALAGALLLAAAPGHRGGRAARASPGRPRVTGPRPPPRRRGEHRGAGGPPRPPRSHACHQGHTAQDRAVDAQQPPDLRGDGGEHRRRLRRPGDQRRLLLGDPVARSRHHQALRRLLGGQPPVFQRAPGEETDHDGAGRPRDRPLTSPPGRNPGARRPCRVLDCGIGIRLDEPRRSSSAIGDGPQLPVTCTARAVAIGAMLSTVTSGSASPSRRRLPGLWAYPMLRTRRLWPRRCRPRSPR